MGGGEAVPVPPLRVDEPKNSGAQQGKNPLIMYNDEVSKEENTAKYIVGIGILTMPLIMYSYK
jgi:hypothetical protein